MRNDDDGLGWFFLYVTGGFPLGLMFITQTAGWGPALGLALVTYWWWPTWWGRAIKR